MRIRINILHAEICNLVLEKTSGKSLLDAWRGLAYSKDGLSIVIAVLATHSKWAPLVALNETTVSTHVCPERWHHGMMGHEAIGVCEVVDKCLYV